MTGIEYALSEVMEPHLFVIRKQKRDGPDKVTHMLTYYILDGSIYQAPQLCNVFASRIVCVLTFPLKMQSTCLRPLQTNSRSLLVMILYEWVGEDTLLCVKGFYNCCLKAREDWIQ